MADDHVTEQAGTGADGAGATDGAAAAGGAIAGQGLVDQPKRGGFGGILDAILRGLKPAVRGTTRRVRVPSRGRRRTSTTSRGSSRSSSTPSSSSSGSAGTLLQLHYREGGRDSWATTRVAYGRRGNRIAAVASSDAAWWRHIRSGSAIQVRVRNQWVDGHARVVSRDEDTYARAVGIFIEDRTQGAARRLGVPMDEHGRLDHGARRPGDAVVVWIEVEGA